MTVVQLNCHRCGRPMPPLSEDDKRLLAAGIAFTASHEVCPDEDGAIPDPGAPPAGARLFELRYAVVELVDDDSPTSPTVHESITGRVPMHAEDLASAMRPLALAFGERWPKLEVRAALADRLNPLNQEG